MAQAEQQELARLANDVADAMKAKLWGKADEGWFGWDEAENRQRIVEMLFAHIERAATDPHQWIDVINLAAFLWWHGEKQQRQRRRARGAADAE